MKQLTPEEDEALACTPPEELLGLELLQPRNIRDTLHAYQLAKRCNEKRVMAESVKWGGRAPGSTPSPRALLSRPWPWTSSTGPGATSTKNMFAKCPAGRPGTADEVANVAELLMGPQGRLHHRGRLFD